MTTNFNSATPKTYKQQAPYVPPIPYVDLPKVNFTKPSNSIKQYQLPNFPYKNNGNFNIPLIPPPLPIAPKLVSKHSVSYAESLIDNIPKPVDAFLQNNIDVPSNSFVTKPPPLPVTTPLIVNPVLPPLSQNNFPYNSELSRNNIPISNSTNANPLQLNLSTPLPNENASNSASAKKPPAKVKFSDTVTAFIVPEIRRPVRPPPPPHVTDPQKELADSLPLCHPNEDYLKDFTPAQKNESPEATNQPKIKVVHFGIV